MKTLGEFHSFFAPPNEVRLVHKNEVSTSRGTERPTVLGWCRILRTHYQWPLFEAIRYVLWLSR